MAKKEDEAYQQLTTNSGVGPVTTTALIAAVGKGSEFRKGRDPAAGIGMVPGKHSSKRYWASANGATPTYDDSSRRVHASSCNHQAPGLSRW